MPNHIFRACKRTLQQQRLPTIRPKRKKSAPDSIPQEALDAGLVTVAPDDLDWEDELRQAIESRAALSPDGLTGLEANLRFGPNETTETRIFGRLSAWQNWIFIRPNAVGPVGALKVYGTGAPTKFAGSARLTTAISTHHQFPFSLFHFPTEVPMIDYTEKIPNSTLTSVATAFSSALSNTGNPPSSAGGPIWAPTNPPTTRSTSALPPALNPTAGHNSATSACPNIAGEFFFSRAMSSAS